MPPEVSDPANHEHDCAHYGLVFSGAESFWAQPFTDDRMQANIMDPAWADFLETQNQQEGGCYDSRDVALHKV